MRYIGNKIRLLESIHSLIKEKNIDNENYTFCDAFSGTASVSEYLKDKFRIIANDVQYYSYIISQAKLNTPDFKFSKLGINPFDYFNSTNIEYRGFIYKNYSLGGSNRMYFSEENALKIDFIRNKIEEWYKEEKINSKEYFYLIACLIESSSKVANIAGVYGSYLKKWDPRAVKLMPFIKVEQQEKESLFEAEVHNKSIEELINYISGDILYLDPPYTKNQYSVQYHLLETIAKNDNPEIKGKGGLRNTSETSSSFSKPTEVEVIFEKIIAKANFKHIILSYSSDGLMSSKYIENVLKRYGKIETFDFIKIPYIKYQNHQTSDNNSHCEYLFYIEKKNDKDILYSSPLNYQGGKYDLISFIRNNLPKNKIKRFVDVFGGGYNVGINIDAEQIIYNEYNHKVVELMEVFKDTETDYFVKYIKKMIIKYGLEKAEKEPYLKLRNKYNSIPLNERDPKMLYLLILYGFNQQIRFNSSYDFNNPIGPANFNDNILEKIISFCRRIQEQNIIFLSKDFELTKEYLNKDTFVYCDPPYLITLGSYNDGKRGFNGWDENDETRLYKFLDYLNKNNIKFMLSNVIEHKGKTNLMLKKWINDGNYNIIKYTGSARKGRKEVLITNYKQ